MSGERFKNLILHPLLIAGCSADFTVPMHTLQPKHVKLKPEEVKALLQKYNISNAQLPKIKVVDPAVPEGCERGDILKIERDVEGKMRAYYRVVI
jgi:DNA-directed RNA polymerase subunit H (RpoH/RPB5)